MLRGIRSKYNWSECCTCVSCSKPSEWVFPSDRTLRHFVQKSSLIISSPVTLFHFAALQFAKIIISRFKTINVCVCLWGECWRMLITIISILLLQPATDAVGEELLTEAGRMLLHWIILWRKDSVTFLSSHLQQFSSVWTKCVEKNCFPET